MKADFAGFEYFIKTKMSKICNNEYFHGLSGEKNDIKETSNSNHLLLIAYQHLLKTILG